MTEEPPEPAVEGQATAPPQPVRGSPRVAVIGVLLVLAGLGLLAIQALDFDVSRLTWPFYVIVPGIVLVVLGLTQRSGSGLTVAGCIVTIVGLVLLYQNATDHWESWAYAWALVGPGGSGLGMLLHGTRTGNGTMARAGFWQVVGAIGLFALGLVFFEGVIGISGRRLPLPDWILPAAVMVLGVIVLVRGWTARRDRGSEA